MKPQIHEDLTRPAQVRRGSDRQFGFVLGTLLAALGLWPLLRHRPMRLTVLAVGAALALIGLIAPILLRPLNRAWTALGLLLGRVVNPVAMAVLFYLLFTPLGLLLRLFGKDLLRLRGDKTASSYWIERQPPGPPPGTMVNQF
ncbi:MAG TPA: SxtJ family membrane protein [Bryobacteraceae bacterium]|nr:SxtJ family membrane protein [Bryobacteraceae bacterium]